MLQSAVSDDFDAMLAALDLVFRWLVLRMCEGNTQVGSLLFLIKHLCDSCLAPEPCFVSLRCDVCRR